MSLPFVATSNDGMLGLAAAFTIGIAFGWTLERAGLGNARKLVGQFLLTDLTVFKVMFSAVLTAMLGVFWLARLGWLDLARVAVPDTAFPPQLLGGALFGVGFAVAGLCPGTSCVAAASGRLDGVAAVLGMFGGVLATGLALGTSPGLVQFCERSTRGPLLLPEVFSLPYGVMVAVVVGLALVGFRAAEWLEQRSR